MSDLPVLNEVLLEKTLEVIEAHPEHWYQGTWSMDVTPLAASGWSIMLGRRLDCGTAYCFAGWAVELDGSVSHWSGPCSVVTQDGHDRGVQFHAQRVLGLTNREAESLFHGDNDLTALRAQVGALLEGDRIRDRDL